MTVGILLGHDQTHQARFWVRPVSGPKESSPVKRSRITGPAGAGQLAADTKTQPKIVHAIIEKAQLTAGHHLSLIRGEHTNPIIDAAIQQQLQEYVIITRRRRKARSSRIIRFLLP